MKKLLLALLLFPFPVWGQLSLSTASSSVINAPIDANGWRSYKVLLTQNATFSFTILPNGTPPPSQSILTVEFLENATGGFTVTFASNISNACTVTTTANAVTICQFVYDSSSNTWNGISGGGGGGTPTPGQTFTVSPNCNGAANCFPVKGDTQYIWDGTTVSGQNTISCPNNDCNFTAADDGANCFATNAPLAGFTGQVASVVALPEGLFTHTGAQTGTCSGGNATLNLTGIAVFFWGHPDTTTGAGGGTDLVAAAWNATIAACGTLHAGGINKQGTGPLMLWLEQPEFNTGTGITNATCAAGSEGNRRGLTVSGTDINSTYFLIAPNMAYANCPTNGCWLTMADGENLHDFTMWGAGVSNGGSTLSSGHALVCINCVLGVTSGNNTVNNVRWQGLSGGATNNTFGVVVQAGNTHFSHVEIDSWGATNLECLACQVSHFESLYAGDSNNEALEITGGSTINITTVDSTFGPSLAATHNIVKFQGAAGSRWTSIGDQITDFSISSAISGNVYCNGAGEIVLDSDNLLTAQNQALFMDSSCVAKALNTKFQAQAAGSFAVNNSAGTFVDEGGNKETGVSGPYTATSSSTLVADGHSLKAVCTGTVTANTTVALLSSGTSLTGTALTTACTGTTLDKGIPVNGARTLQTLICTSSATTVAVVCTVMTSHNGGAFASSGITCTMTAATFCIDSTHTLAVADGDFVTIQAAGGAAETGANIKALTEWN